jgi:hypothetical protein
MLAYSPVMTWLLLDSDGDLSILEEPQGQTSYYGDDTIIAQTGSFHKAHGDGAEIDESTGRPYKTQRDYLTDLLGRADYERIFCNKKMEVSS